MALDFANPAITTDERIIESARAAGMKDPRRGVLGNRGEPDPDDKLGEPSLHDEFVPVNNANAELLFVRAYAVPSLGFFADWKSGASFTLVQWQWGPIDWARSE